MKRIFGLALAASALCCGTASAQVSDRVVKLGVFNDMSSLYADIGGKGSVLAAQMAVEDFGGNVLGVPIEIVSGDHQNKPDIGAGIARKWIDTDHVDAIVDVPTSSVALAIQEVTREKRRLFLMSGPASFDLSGKACKPYGIQWTYDTYALAHGTGGALVKQGGDSWFFITADYAFGHALERDTGEAVKNRDGPGAQAARPMICSIGRRQDDRFCSGKFGILSQGSGQTNSVSCRDGTTADMIRAY